MSRFVRAMLIAVFLGVLAVPGQVAAQKPKVTKYAYTAIDLGTLGGPSTQFAAPGVRLIIGGGAVLVQADTRVHDPDYRKSGANEISLDRHISHAALWQNGRLTDMGALPGNNSSTVLGMNSHGEGVGISQNGTLDPLVGSPKVRAVVWRGGNMITLPTFGGTESTASAVNDKGLVVGLATNAIRDHFTLDTWYPTGAQARAFLWTNGKGMTDLGTLGGPDSAASYVNNGGQITGVSFTNAKANSTTGIPT